MLTILDVGGEGNLSQRNRLSCRPDHPVWGQVAWFTANIEASKRPDILADAITLSSVRDASVDGIYSSHTIEHIDVDLSRQMFENWFRVLRPGGRIEIRCPDTEWTWREYFAGHLPEPIITELLMGIRTGPYEVHRNLWWGGKLISELSAQGFVNARRIDYGFTHPLLDFWLYDGKHPEYHGFKVIDLLIEAYKPDSGAAVQTPNTRPAKSLVRQRSAVVTAAATWAPYKLREVAQRIHLFQQRKAARRALRSILVPEPAAESEHHRS